MRQLHGALQLQEGGFFNDITAAKDADGLRRLLQHKLARSVPHLLPAFSEVSTYLMSRPGSLGFELRHG